VTSAIQKRFNRSSKGVFPEGIKRRSPGHSGEKLEKGKTEERRSDYSWENAKKMSFGRRASELGTENRRKEKLRREKKRRGHGILNIREVFRGGHAERKLERKPCFWGGASSQKATKKEKEVQI